MQGTAPSMGLALRLRRYSALRAASGKRFATLRVAGPALERGYKASRDKCLGAVPLFASGVRVRRADERTSGTAQQHSSGSIAWCALSGRRVVRLSAVSSAHEVDHFVLALQTG